MNRLNLLRLPALLAVWLLLSSCEKDIELDLNTSPAQLVVEANLADDGQPCVVRLSQSTAFSEPNTFPAVRGATVTLRDATDGASEVLRETSPGQYEGAAVLGQVGHRYTLTVEANGQTYTAESVLPAPVPLTGLGLETITLGPDDVLAIVPEYNDPAGVRNYYYFRVDVNGVRQKTLYLLDDEFTDGNANEQPLQGGLDEDELESGDNVLVELRNVDSANYEYVRTLNQILEDNPLFTTTPANPRSNISGGALGYFSAYSVQRRRLVVP